MADSPNSSADKDNELTMCDVLEEEKELEDDANAVLGGSDDKNCSYDQGYVPRQALYACLTCKVNGEAGICLACCYACHDGHEVVELYTKRNFRCDCGNSKFGDKKCTLRPDKDPVNIKNKYNHNFKGLYCTCERPYPDMEDNVSDEMIQCVFCEDWYHGRHLSVPVPEDYYEMICNKCMESHPFLYTYLNQYEIKVDVETIPSEATAIKMENGTSSNNCVKEEPKQGNENGSLIKTESMAVDNGIKTETSNENSVKSETKPSAACQCLLHKCVAILSWICCKVVIFSCGVCNLS